MQAVNTHYRERDYSFYVQDDYKVSSKLTLNLGLRWQLIHGLYETSGFVTNADLTRPNPAAGNLPGALRFADEEGRKTFIDPYYKQFQPRLGVAYAMSPTLALSGGYSVSNRPATAYTDGEFGGLDSTGYNGTIAVNRDTRPTPNAQDPVIYLSDRYPDFAGALPNRDPSQRNNQGVTVIIGDEAKREQYHNFNVTVRNQLPGNFSTTVAYIGAQGRDLPFDSQINRVPFAALAQYGDLLFSSLASQPQLGIPTPYPGFTGTVQQALARLPAVHGHHAPEQLQGQDPLQLAAGDPRASLHAGFALLAAYTLSKTEDNVLKQDGSGDEWALANNRHIPHFLKITWIYELPIGPGKRFDVGGVLGHIVGGWTLTGIHNYRAGGTLWVYDSRYNTGIADRDRVVNAVGYPIRPDVIDGVDQVIYEGGSADTVRGTPYLNPAAFATQPLTAQGIPTARRHRAADSVGARAGPVHRGLRAVEARHGRRGAERRVQSRLHQRAEPIGPW